MSEVAADDDVVRTHAEAAGNDRPPLLVLDPLVAYLDAHGIGAGEIEAVRITGGLSNATFLLRRGDVEVILRRPPRPPIPPSAHDVLREARFLAPLADTPARVPRVLAACSDLEVIGAPFYVMERIEGHVVTDAVPAELDTPDDRRRMGEELVDALVELHAVDWQATELRDFGRPSGYLERQLRRFTGLWEHNRTRELALVDEVGRWLEANLPESPPATIVHGDYRLGNMIVSPRSPARLVAILDWEMATIGDPLADVGYLSTVWADPDDPPARLYELSAVTRTGGFPSRAELLERYERRSGRRMTDIRWYQTLALWKSAVFMEGNHKRALAGATDEPYLKEFGGGGVVELAERAHAVAHAT